MFELEAKLDMIEMSRVGRQGGLHPYICEYLYEFVKKHKLNLVLETGVSWGFSSSYFLAALRPKGKLVSIENHLMPLDERVVPLEWYDHWEIVEGDARDVLQSTCERLKHIDLFWHDSSHSFRNQLFEYRTAMPYAKYIGSHDINRRKGASAWSRFVKESGATVIKQDGNFGLAKVGK